jgi:sterol desaturase/sphingolipid hydroxylase (fatty acid hydroxylase superfamily)
MRLESTAYWIVFVTAFLGLAFCESKQPTRRLLVDEQRRWRNHAGMFVIGFALTGLLLRGLAPVAFAALVSRGGFGVFNRVALPLAAQWLISIVLLDFVKYAVHRSLHASSMLWRLHQVHHSDPDFDVSTVGRFHPLELLITQGGYLAMIALLATPPGAVLLAEVIGAFHGSFAHANISLPRWLETRLRWVLITPDMHRMHHSEKSAEHRRNFGDVFPWWDYLLNTYVETPAAGPQTVVTGLKGFQNEESVGLGFMLALPFRRQRD